MSGAIDGAGLIARLAKLGSVGRDGSGRLTRLAGSDADKAGRDLLCDWMQAVGLQIEIDRIGNIYGIWQPDGAAGAPVLTGSHIDTVIDAGIYDGCYGVLASLSVIEALQAGGASPARPLAVVAFTNEEGVRFQPDMMGSLVAAGGLNIDTALASVGTDGSILGHELARIGYDGPRQPGFLRPHAYIELHIEQGPVLETEQLRLGVVENLQGISWQQVKIRGRANHAGTTPMHLRHDAGVAAARLIAFLDDLARKTPDAVATVGTIELLPGAINVIPAAALLSIDMRNPDESRLLAQEAALSDFLDGLRTDGFDVRTRSIARFQPVAFDGAILTAIEKAAESRQMSWRRMTSGAGHDAQMIARVAPTAMIFVPSQGGISHNPAEFTAESDLVGGANVLLDVVRSLAFD